MATSGFVLTVVPFVPASAVSFMAVERGVRQGAPGALCCPEPLLKSSLTFTTCGPYSRARQKNTLVAGHVLKSLTKSLIVDEVIHSDIRCSCPSGRFRMLPWHWQAAADIVVRDIRCSMKLSCLPLPLLFLFLSR